MSILREIGWYGVIRPIVIIVSQVIRWAIVDTIVYVGRATFVVHGKIRHQYRPIYRGNQYICWYILNVAENNTETH